MIAGCSASAVSRTEAPISSVFTSALMVDSSATWFMSMSTGGATMPRRIFTTRSVPPPSGMLPGLAARAASASSSVAGLSMRKSGRASINLSPLAKNECSSHEPQQTPSPLVGEGWGGGWWRSAKLHHPPPPPPPPKGGGRATARGHNKQKPTTPPPLTPPHKGEGNGNCERTNKPKAITLRLHYPCAAASQSPRTRARASPADR